MIKSNKVPVVFVFLVVKLNGGRHVQGILRGFDPFMNLVVDDTLEMGPGGQQNSIGMVVSTWAGVHVLIFLLSENSNKRTGNCLKTLCSPLCLPFFLFDGLNYEVEIALTCLSPLSLIPL